MIWEKLEYLVGVAKKIQPGMYILTWTSMNIDG
jgi:hypothetical protein